MKKGVFLTLWAIGCLLFVSCSGKNQGTNNNSEVKEGRISTHTRTNHTIHQEITPEERELAKDHIKNETAPGVSIVTIDAEGAKMINDSRKTEK